MSQSGAELPPLEYEAPRDRAQRKTQLLYPLPYAVRRSDHRIRMVTLVIFLILGLLVWMTGDLVRVMMVIPLVSFAVVMWVMLNRRPFMELLDEGIIIRNGPLVRWEQILRARELGNGVTFLFDDSTRLRVSFWDMMSHDVNVLRQVLKDKGL